MADLDRQTDKIGGAAVTSGPEDWQAGSRPSASGEMTPGSRFGRYSIVEPLGAGGMGVVYRARDEKLERDVAIKVLSAGSLTRDARRRLRKEGLALAKLSHPQAYEFRRCCKRWSETRIALAMIVSEGLTALAETKHDASTT
jgi:serine/threonine protein kinase